MSARRPALMPAPIPYPPMGPPPSGAASPAAVLPHLEVGSQTLGPVEKPQQLTAGEELVVRDIMTTCLVTTGRDVKLDAAARLLRFHQISGLPVVRGTRLEGVLSERDILRGLAQQGGLSVASEVIDHVLDNPSRERLVRRAKWRGVLERLHVKDVMTSPAITVTPDTSVESALRWMLVKHIQRLPVKSGEHLVGIVTRGDVMTSLEREHLSRATSSVRYR